MVHGYFPADTNLPYIEVSIFLNKKILRIPLVIDTGFSGHLKIDQQSADELGIVSVVVDCKNRIAHLERVA